MSVKASQRTVSETAKAKISNSLKNREFSESHLEKLKVSLIGNKNGLGGKGGGAASIGGKGGGLSTSPIDGVTPLQQQMADFQKLQKQN
jgi:hypothetical protein